MYTVGDSASITCTISSATRIEWLRNDSMVHSGAGSPLTIQISVNDSIHHDLYTCRGYSIFSILAELDITMIVNGMCVNTGINIFVVLYAYVQKPPRHKLFTLLLLFLFCVRSAKCCNLYLRNCCVSSQFGSEPHHSLYCH